LKPSVVFPLFLRVEGRRVVVVGAGEIATRKAKDLLDAGARVTVVAPRATETLQALAAAKQVLWNARAFEPRDLDEAWLVVAATDDARAQAEIGEAAETRRIWLVAMDDLSHATAFSGSILRRPPFLVALSSSAEAPALTRLLREVLEQALPNDTWVAAARALRADWRARGTPMTSRFEELVRAFTDRAKRD
jgi:uroporphyrin-III C-methyltransferase / precorrin-2 dehydrogenase / sirohydrochlorin ferrochelatase